MSDTELAAVRLDRLSVLWAKTGEAGTFHPLILHLLDVARCADAILRREPAATRERFGSKASPGPQLAVVTVSGARLRLLGCRGQRDRAWVGDGCQGGSLQVRS